LYLILIFKRFHLGSANYENIAIAQLVCHLNTTGSAGRAQQRLSSGEFALLVQKKLRKTFTRGHMFEQLCNLFCKKQHW